MTHSMLAKVVVLAKTRIPLSKEIVLLWSFILFLFFSFFSIFFFSPNFPSFALMVNATQKPREPGGENSR